MPEVQNVPTRHQAPPPAGRRAWQIVLVLCCVFAVVALSVAAVAPVQGRSPASAGNAPIPS